MADSILDLILRIKKSGSGAKDAAKEVSDLQKAAGGLKTGIGALGIAAGVLAGAYAAIITPTLAYSKTVRDLSRNIGISTDETSRLIQVADDYQISSEELTGALQMAVKKGFEPNTESLAKLADEYNAIEDPVKRASMLSEKFGKNWSVITPLLEAGGDAIRKQSAAIDEHLVLSQEEVDQARALEMGIDNLQDQWQGFTTMIAQAAIPVLNNAMTGFDNLRKMVAATTIATQLHNGNITQQQASFRAAQLAGDSYTEAINKVYGAEIALTDASDRHVQVAAAVTAAIEPEKTETIDYAAASRDATQALADLQAKQDGWAASTGQDVINALNEAGVKGREYEAALLAIDAQLGTGFANEEATQQKLSAITDEFKKTGNIDAYKASLAALYDDAMPRAIQSFDEFTGRSEALAASLRAIPTTVNVSVVTTYSSTGQPQNRRAHGGPVSSGESYLVGEQGPEMFIPNQAGQIASNSVTNNIVNNNAVSINGANASLSVLESIIERVLRRNGAQMDARNRTR